MSVDPDPDLPAPWEQAWHHALYGPAGFYRSTPPAAAFATSAQGIPGAGRVLAGAVAALAERHGCTRVVDLGAGRGELLTALRQVAPTLHLTGVDVVARPPGLDVDDWLVSPGGAALPDHLDDLVDTLVLAHEWLDVVPCPVVARDADQVWRAVTVLPDGTEQLGSPLAGVAAAWADRHLRAEVRRAEIGLPRERALRDLLSRVGDGVVAAVDYGHTGDDRPAHGTLTGFRGGREVEPVPDGSCDLTAHVAVDALLADLRSHGHEADATRQGALLIDLLGDPSTPVPIELARSRPAAYLAALAHRSALRALTTGTLGDFWWVLVRMPPATPARVRPPGAGPGIG